MPIDKFQGEISVYGSVSQPDLTRTFAANNIFARGSIIINGVDIDETVLPNSNGVLFWLVSVTRRILGLPLESEPAGNVVQSASRGDMIIRCKIVATNKNAALNFNNLEIKIKDIAIGGVSLGDSAMALLETQGSQEASDLYVLREVLLIAYCEYRGIPGVPQDN